MAVISATTVARASGVAVGIGVAAGWARAVAVISATTVARASGVGAALGSEATGDETAAGAGSPQASAMSDTQRTRASGRLRLAEIIPPVHEKSDARAGFAFGVQTRFAYQVMGIVEGLRRESPQRRAAGERLGNGWESLRLHRDRRLAVSEKNTRRAQSRAGGGARSP